MKPGDIFIYNPSPSACHSFVKFRGEKVELVEIERCSVRIKLVDGRFVGKLNTWTTNCTSLTPYKQGHALTNIFK